jgi:hypothetical protein
MEPAERKLPRFFQAYVHDAANEGSNWQMQNLNLSLLHLTTLCTIFERVNLHVYVFVHAADRFAANLEEEVHICITTGHTREMEMSTVTTVLQQTRLQ